MLNTLGSLLNGPDIFPRRLGVDFVNELVTFLLSVEKESGCGKPYPPFAIETDLTQIPQNDYPRLFFP